MAMETSGLAAEWEQSCEVKKRVVNGGKLLNFQEGQKWCVPTRQNANQNKCMLLPCLEKLRSTPNLHLPHLQGLQDELTELYEGFGKAPPTKGVYKQAVELKKLMGFVKRRANRNEVTKDRSHRETRNNKYNGMFKHFRFYFCLTGCRINSSSAPLDRIWSSMSSCSHWIRV